MPYNEQLAERLRGQLAGAKHVTEQEMFGGISFLIAGHMCCGVLGDDVVVRIDPTLHHDALTRPGVSEFVMGGRTSKGMVRVGPAGTTDDLDLGLWVRLGVNHATELPSRPAKKAAAGKRGKTAPTKKAPARKKAAPAKKKTAPARKKSAARARPTPVKKKAAAKRAAATKKRASSSSSTRKTTKTTRATRTTKKQRTAAATKKRSAPAGKKATKATRAKKATKARKAPRTRK